MGLGRHFQIVGEQFLQGPVERRHAQRLKRLEPRFQHRILVHAIGMKLLEDPFLQPDLLHPRHVPRARSKSEAIERVQDLVVFRELLLK